MLSFARLRWARLAAMPLVWFCTSLHPVLAQDDRPVILAIGESTTAGYGLPDGQSYPAQLQQLLDEQGYRYRVVNFGRSGISTEMALSDLHRGMLLQPEIVLIALGGNDRSAMRTTGRTETNLRKMVALFVQMDAYVFLADRTPASDGGDAGQMSLYGRIAAEEGATLMPSLRQDIAGNANLLLDDMRHPNAAGYAIIARRIFNLLEPVLQPKDATP